MSSIEYKSLEFKLEETKQELINGQRVGIIKGLAAAFSTDRVNDRIEKGAFLKTIKEHKKRNNRPIRMKFMHNHDDVIGGFPIGSVKENDSGLFVEGHINLEVQKGAEAFSLAKQGVLQDMSIGFIPVVIEFDHENDLRVIKQIDLREISIVDEPANVDAVITEVKGAVPFQDLPLSDLTRVWNPQDAMERVKNLEGMIDSDGKPSKLFKNAFMFFDYSQPENIESYKSKALFSDVIDGKLKAVPDGILAARGALAEPRGVMDIPASDRMRVKQNINKYFRKINKEFDRNLEIPFKSFNIENELDIKTVRDIENLLTGDGFSRSEAKKIISIIKNSQRDADSDNSSNNSEQKDTLRDASVEKIDHILLIQKLNTII